MRAFVPVVLIGCGQVVGEFLLDLATVYRVGNLESRLQELSGTVAACERLRELDQVPYRYRYLPTYHTFQ